MTKAVRVFWSAFVLFLISIGAMAFIVYFQFMTLPSTLEEKKIVYEVKPGMTVFEIAKDLESAQVIRNARLFGWMARLKGEQGKAKVGEYELSSHMRPLAILEVLNSGRSLARKFTVSEGLSIFEIADLFQKQGFGLAKDFLAKTKDPILIQKLLQSRLGNQKIESLEGYLFPETYLVNRYMTAELVLTSMVEMFWKEYDKIVTANVLPGWTAHQIVTLASIIEKETGAPFERKRISAVFHNRLRKKMKLQTDPTIIYGKAVTSGQIVINITRQDLSTPTAYNTYVIPALPPGPICNPGLAALQAAINPETTDDLFFVSQNDGTHVFSKTYQEHELAVRKYQLDRKAREGKSWRDLNQAKD